MRESSLIHLTTPRLSQITSLHKSEIRKKPAFNRINISDDVPSKLNVNASELSEPDDLASIKDSE